MKNKKEFNPEAWHTSNEKPATSKISKIADISIPADGIVNDIETVVQRIEDARLDITQGYGNWRDLGFALSSELGESGRPLFHRISCFHPEYNAQETDKQYDKCLRSHGSGITKGTLSDVSFLQSHSGMEAITMLHVEGITDYLAR